VGPVGAVRRQGPRWLLAGLLAGAAASTLTTALAAAVAGRQADLALQPVELALRIALLLGAPCAGALLAALVVPGGGRGAVVAVGVGVPVGPLLVLRLDRVREFGLGPVLVVAAVLVAWATVGAALAAGWWGRPARQASVRRTELPVPPPEDRAAHDRGATPTPDAGRVVGGVRGGAGSPPNEPGPAGGTPPDQPA
jgi:hypothetical protein